MKSIKVSVPLPVVALGVVLLVYVYRHSINAPSAPGPVIYN